MKLRNRGCPSEGDLQAVLDEDEAGRAAATHAGRCERCARRLAEMRELDAFVRQKLAILADHVDVNTIAAFADVRRKLDERALAGQMGGGNNMTDFWERRVTRGVAAVAVLVMMAASLSFTPMRTLAEDFLGQLRVQEFAAVTIPMDMVEPLESGALQSMTGMDHERLHDELGELGTFETTFQFGPEHLPQPMMLDEARAVYGDVDAPDQLPEGFNAAPEAYVTEAGSASYTLNVGHARSLIQELGLPFYSLPDPAQHPTLTFTANVPSAVILHYTDGEHGNVVVGQMESPTLDIPEGIDMDMVREDLLQFPGLPADLVAQLRSIDNWENTLIIPIPEGATSENITINGEPGLVIESAEGSAVLWQKDGKLYVVAGQAPDEVRAIADSMQ